jgi:hypothetical protein
MRESRLCHHRQAWWLQSQSLWYRSAFREARRTVNMSPAGSFNETGLQKNVHGCWKPWRRRLFWFGWRTYAVIQGVSEGTVILGSWFRASYSLYIYRVSQILCHKLFLGIPHPHLSKNVPINVGPKMNRFRDIDCLVKIREMLWLTFQPLSTPIPEWPFPWEVDRA